MLNNRAMHLGILAAVSLLLLAGCSGSMASQAEAQEIIVVRDNPALPEGCSPTEVAQLIMSFLDAYNRGDREQLADFFPSTFEWYSDTIVDSAEDDDKRSFDFSFRNRLLDYVAERHQHGDRLQLVAVNVAGPGWHGGADIAFTLTREANDVRRGPEGRERYAVGGGAIRCQSQKIWAWGMGTAPPDFPESDLSHVCPVPPDGAPENAVVACARPVPEGEG